MKEIFPVFIASLAFALYVTCPRMTAMLVSQAKIMRISPLVVIALGCMLGIPLFIILFYTLKFWGLTAAIVLAAVFDFGAAILLGALNVKAGLELAIITAFVYVGIRLAPWIANAIISLVA